MSDHHRLDGNDISPEKAILSTTSSGRLNVPVEPILDILKAYDSKNKGPITNSNWVFYPDVYGGLINHYITFERNNASACVLINGMNNNGAIKVSLKRLGSSENVKTTLIKATMTDLINSVNAASNSQNTNKFVTQTIILGAINQREFIIPPRGLYLFTIVGIRSDNLKITTHGGYTPTTSTSYREQNVENSNSEVETSLNIPDKTLSIPQKIKQVLRKIDCC